MANNGKSDTAKCQTKQELAGSEAGSSPVASTSRPAPLDLQQQQLVDDEASNIFDRLVALNMDKDAQSPTLPITTSHPSIFRTGTLIEIPDIPSQNAPRRGRRKSQLSELKPRLVAICIKADAQAEYIIDWVLQNELVPGRDRVVLVN
ncbi:hypothetical protein GGF48_003215, partial [Coemansia sp. RSA 921]